MHALGKLKFKRTGLGLTHEGKVFMVGIFTLLLVALAYANNLALLFVFSILATTIVALAYGKSIANKINVTLVEVNPGFSGQVITAKIHILNQSQESLPYVTARLKLVVKRKNYFFSTSKNQEQRIPVSAGTVATVTIPFKAKQRGVYEVPHCQLVIDYPMALLEFKKSFFQHRRYVIYPNPQGGRPWPVRDNADESEGINTKVSGEDFYGHSYYEQGTSQKRIDWKLYARSNVLMNKEFRSGAERAIIFSWNDLPGLAIEDRLSQLCEWIIQAEQKGVSFGLQLPKQGVELGQGKLHCHECLCLLAEFNEANDL